MYDNPYVIIYFGKGAHEVERVLSGFNDFADAKDYQDEYGGLDDDYAIVEVESP